MAPYEIGPPTAKLSSDDEKALLEGKTLMQAIVQSDGTSRRLLMVKDIQAPPHIIFSRILDLEAYPRMVKGVDGVKIYESKTDKKGVQAIKAKYDIHAVHLKFTCEHAISRTRTLLLHGLSSLHDRPPDSVRAAKPV